MNRAEGRAITRRDFLRAAAGVTGAAALATRIAGEARALDAPPIHILVAEKKYHLGVSDLSRIQLIKIGWMEDALI